MKKFKVGSLTYINSYATDLINIGIDKDDCEKILSRIGVVQKIWGKENNKYNIRFSGVSNNGYDYCFEERMLKGLGK
jgi:hypothetical protein